MKQLLTRSWRSLDGWLDARTGYRILASDALYENIPGGSRWIYVTGSMLVCAFVTQAITGFFLWMSYSPGSQNAWESVYFIQNEVYGGFLLRGVHHYMAQAMVVLLPLHLLQVVLCKAYVAPREINYWLGLVLMLLVLGLGLTGYLLPWDQKGYWATKVATELMALPPGGGAMQRLAVGGSEYGHATLTRFFALHAGVLPTLLVLVLAVHVALFRKHGITAKSSQRRADEFFWPQQVFKDAAACFLMLAAVVGITLYRGAELGPPAEPTEAYGAARPEWYFLFLFQLLKKFKSEFVGAIVVPTLVMAFLFLLPFTGRVRIGHVVNVVVLLALVGFAGYLTGEAVYHDNYHAWNTTAPADQAAAELHKERTESALDFHESKELAEREYQRIKELISYYGIPPIGASASLVHHDPEIQGPRIFRSNCAMCHSFLDDQGRGIRGPEVIKTADGKYEPNGAPNLYGFATRAWFEKFLNPLQIAEPGLLGTTAHAAGDMVTGFVQAELVDLSEEQKKHVELIAAALAAEAKLPPASVAPQSSLSDEQIARGREAVTTAVKDQACTDCHKFHDAGDLGSAPDLTGYGTYEWLRDFIANPAHERFYGDRNDRMPSFAAHPNAPEKNLMTSHELDMLVRWLRGDNRDITRGPVPSNNGHPPQ